MLYETTHSYAFPVHMTDHFCTFGSKGPNSSSTSALSNPFPFCSFIPAICLAQVTYGSIAFLTPPEEPLAEGGSSALILYGYISILMPGII